MSQYQLASLCCYFSSKLLLPQENVFSSGFDISCEDVDITNPSAKDVPRIVTISIYGDKRSGINFNLPLEMSYLIDNITVLSASQRTDFITFLESISIQEAQFETASYTQLDDPDSPEFLAETDAVINY